MGRLEPRGRRQHALNTSFETPFLERDEKKCAHFFARIPLHTVRIDHVYNFGSIRSKVIVI
jgi:hypothetical protein